MKHGPITKRDIPNLKNRPNGIAGLDANGELNGTIVKDGTLGTDKLGDDITAAGLALLDDAAASDQRTTLGLGTIATQAANNVNITGGAIAGITDLAVADGGTGASTAAAACGSLGAEQTANKNAANGYAGLNASGRITKGSDITDYHVFDSSTRGIVLKSPDAHYWLVQVTDAGALTTTDLGTSKP